RKRSCNRAHWSIPSLIAAVRIFWVLQVPQRSAARNSGDRSEVIFGGRRTYRPLQSPGIPGIVSGFCSLEVRNDQVQDKHQGGDSLDERTDGHEKVQGVPAAPWLVGVDAPRHPKQAGNVHQVKGEMKS